ncbi:MAG: SDR family oxidoreductase [Deltaproteobacteria bacterium]|nr:SDR family oxidoreductase [Deltaproteobacteria bacterium]MBW2051881.1 SDR family oxidoreductase [Deltaproteobacteria bacterium]MBW2141167.1 SDR family oxidoreductase [Deltaproteobacteria bacterium]MBW2324379.1 SDR family oxidoreductase [Deltaproteobacteria bacterium]
MQLNNKVAVITGGGRGIGQAIALAFAREGADVVVSARTAEEIEKTVKKVEEVGRRGVAIPADLGQRKGASSFIGQVFSHFPAVHILVNNAGIGSGQNPKPLVEYDDEFWDVTISLNLTTPYLLMKAFLPGMVEQGWGRIINMSSVAGKQGFPHGTAYSASKHGLIGLTRTAAIEVATSGVTVNAICPGPVRTPMLAKRLQFTSELNGVPLEEIEKSLNPMQRLLDPEEIAAMAVYLASDNSKGITGQSYNISGGSVMH